MRKIALSLSALALAIPASITVPTTAAQASHHYYGHSSRYYHHRRCRYSSGTTGLVAGGVGGALVGHSILGHGVLGTLGGAAGGALAGRAVDRSMTAHRRCR